MCKEAKAVAAKIKALLLDVLNREQSLTAFLNATDEIEPLIDAEYASVFKERDDYKKALGELEKAASIVLKASTRGPVSLWEFGQLRNVAATAKKMLDPIDYAQEKREDKAKEMRQAMEETQEQFGVENEYDEREDR